MTNLLLGPHSCMLCRRQELVSFLGHLQELGNKDSGFELALFGTYHMLLWANFPSAVLWLQSHSYGDTIPSGMLLTAMPET